MKNKKKNNKIYLKILILIGIIGILFLSLFYFVSDKKNNIVFSCIKDISAFTSKIFYYPYNKLNEKYTKSDYDVIESENKTLKKEIDNLKKELDLKKILSDKTIVNASLIKRSTSYWYNMLSIDKGKKDGIKIGNAVMNNGGVIGKVISVSPNSSEVKLITSKHMDDYISAMFIIDNNSYYGLIDGYDIKKNEIHLKNVIGDFNSEIIGVNVVTSGLSDSFSSGLLIGKIKKLDKDNYGISNDIYITPSTNINDITIVSVITN